LGGFINQYADWRWTYYVIIIVGLSNESFPGSVHTGLIFHAITQWSAVELAALYLFVPESHIPSVLRIKAARWVCFVHLGDCFRRL
jgi:hypothetical protein